jgi:two-component system, cell cycle sensor histidine kinase and response regulator CckA
LSEDCEQSDLQLERRQAKEALGASELRYRRLFETAQDGILILDAHSGLIIDVNPFLIRLLDHPREEFIGKALWDIGPFKNIEASKAAFRELLKKKYVRYENLPLETRSGRPVNVEFVSNVYGANGESVIQCNIRDITERKRAEQSDERLRQSQRMEAVGQLAGGISHDFNNLLSVIMGYCELLEERLGAEDAKRRMVEQIHNAGTRAVAVTRQLLAFSRRQVLRPVVLDVNRLVAGMETMLRRLIGEDIEIVTSLLPGLGRVKADPTQMEQILMNLALNARDAMLDGGTITIETANVDVDEIRCPNADVPPGPYVMLALSDTGVGMDSETQARIFEPFFTTKKPGKGTGLGLSTVYGIVKQSAGCICAISELGRGTTFQVYLPFVGAEAEIADVKERISIRGGGETVLLVEDNAPLRELTCEILNGLGYAVLDSGRPLDAIRCAEQHEGPIALLITDVLMPQLNGPALAKIIKAVRPEMKVLYTSGYTDDAIIGECEREAGCPLLEKPFTRDILAKRVRELLDGTVS